MNIFFRVAITLLVFAPAAYAQTVTITSVPGNCTVYLSGEIDLVTTTPATITEQLAGTFIVRAVRPGYEDWVSTVVFSPNTDRNLVIELSPKTRAKAALRSLIIPGWGQYYSGEKTRSFLWGLAALSTGVVAGVYESRYRDYKADWIDGKDRFDNAGTVAEKERLRAEVMRLQDRAYDAETDRRWAWGLVGGVWATNVLDALVFFPEEKRFAGGILGVKPAPDGSSLLTLTFTY